MSMLPKSVIYVVVADTNTGSTAIQPHVTNNVNLAIDHTLSLSDESGHRAFNKFLGVAMSRQDADSLASSYQCDFLDDKFCDPIEVRTPARPSTMGLQRRDLRTRDLWSDDPDRTTRRG